MEGNDGPEGIELVSSDEKETLEQMAESYDVQQKEKGDRNVFFSHGNRQENEFQDFKREMTQYWLFPR